LGCHPTCLTNADCFSNCCIPFQSSMGAATGAGFCVDTHYCGCAPTGTDCSFTPCCAGNTCGNYGGSSNQFICYHNCMGALDCDGGCCSTNLPGKPYGTCAPTCP
jgi:hypothetical protein